MEQRFITMGEIMLRLTPPNYEKIRMTHSFEASYGGAEANIALALANLGIDSTFFTVVPDNSIGKSAIRMLRSNDVHCAPIILSTISSSQPWKNHTLLSHCAFCHRLPCLV